MFAVVFEVQPHPERWNDYLALARELKPKLEAIDGFIDNERFESLRIKGRLLSLSTWRDEKSLVRWRTHADHHGVQEKGRFEIFADYQLRIVEITHDTDPPGGLRVVDTRLDETETGRAKHVTVTELAPKDGATPDADPDALRSELALDAAAGGLLDLEAFASIYNEGKRLLLGSWRDAESARQWAPRRPDWAASIRHRRGRVIRDYGMFDRREAPQFYPDVKRSAAVAAE